MNRKHLFLGTIILLLGAAALFTACSLGGDIDEWYEKAYEEKYGVPPEKPDHGQDSNATPSPLASGATYDQATAKLDEIIAYCYINPGTTNDTIRAKAEYAKSNITMGGSLYWPAMREATVPGINDLINALNAAPGTIIMDMSPDTSIQNYLPAGATDQYRFSVTNGSNYTVEWRDQEIDNSYADIRVRIRQAGTSGYFDFAGAEDTGPLSYTATFTGDIIVEVTGFYPSSSGYYEISYNQSSGNGNGGDVPAKP